MDCRWKIEGYIGDSDGNGEKQEIRALYRDEWTRGYSGMAYRMIK